MNKFSTSWKSFGSNFRIALQFSWPQKKGVVDIFVLLHSMCLTWSDNYSFFAIFECTNVKLLQILIFCNTSSRVLWKISNYKSHSKQDQKYSDRNALKIVRNNRPPKNSLKFTQKLNAKIAQKTSVNHPKTDPKSCQKNHSKNHPLQANKKMPKSPWLGNFDSSDIAIICFYYFYHIIFVQNCRKVEQKISAILVTYSTLFAAGG